MDALLVAAALIFLQAQTPIPREAANDAAGSSQNTQGTSTTQQSPPPDTLPPSNPTTVPANQQPSPNQQAPANQVAPSQNNVSVGVGEPFPVDVKKDGWDYSAWGFSLLLVFVGAGGVIAAVCSLRAINRQARIMIRQARIGHRAVIAAKMSAEAAKKSAEAATVQNSYLINKERARLGLNELKLPVYHQTTKTELADRWRWFSVYYQFHNRGPSEAKITKTCICVTQYAKDEWLVHFDYIGDKALGGIVWPHKSSDEYVVLWTLNDGTDTRDLGFLHFYGFVEYEDIFNLPRKTTFYWRTALKLQTQDGSGQVFDHMEWVKGPAEHNQET